jgi:hypothetical protein
MKLNLVSERKDDHMQQLPNLCELGGVLICLLLAHKVNGVRVVDEFS